MKVFDCTPINYHIVSKSMSCLKATVRDFDMDIFINQEVVKCYYNDRSFECFVDSVETDMRSRQSDLRFVIIKEFSKTGKEMKQEDFDRLKAICEKEGYGIAPDSFHGKTYYHIEPRDIWEGVEFAECLVNYPSQYINGRIYKVKVVNEFNLLTELDDRLSTTNGLNKYSFKPSTESAYIDQLKKEAFERFGVIKDGDRFKSESGSSIAYLRANEEWDYIKSDDQLFYYNVELYKSGKWATKVKKRVEVSWCSFNNHSVTFNYSGDVNMFNKAPDIAKVIEKYLNSEP